MNKLENQRGFTLLELLVSLTIFSMVITIATGAYSLFMGNWKGNVNGYQQAAEQARNQRLTRKIMTSVMPYIYRDEQGTPTYFFDGESKTLRAVTEHSLSDPSYPALFQLKVRQNENGFIVTYSEVSSRDNWLITPEGDQNWSKEVVMFTNKQAISFRYYGWESNQIRVNMMDSGQKPDAYLRWFDDYNASQRGIYPEKIALVLENDNEKTELMFATNQYDTVRFLAYEENR